MKVALCLHGLVGTNDKYGIGKKNINYKIGYQHFKENVFDVNDDVDVFFHTWSTDYEEKLCKIYKPKASISENQPHYSDNPRNQAIFCRWNSVKKVINLVSESENQYDFILLTRFDIAFLVNFNFFEYDNSKFYAQGPAGPSKNGIKQVNDLWFFSNQKNMMQFSTLYDHLKDDDYKIHLDSNHELARKHILKTGLSDNLEYKFTREWNGAPGKLSTDTPLVRWHYLNKV